MLGGIKLKIETDRYKLYHGDCLEVMKNISDKSIDMILCDMPYGMTSRNKWDIIIPFDKLWNQYTRIIKDNSAIVLFGKQPFTSMMIMSNPKIYKYNMIWRKNLKSGHLNTKRIPMGAYEDIMVFYKKQPIYNPQKIPRTYQKPSKKSYYTESTNYGRQRGDYIDNQSNWLYPDDVIDYEDGVNLDALDLENEMLYIKCVHNSSGKLHPTQKPVELLEWLIKTYTDENMTILDNCMGSGSTGVACLNTNRKFIGIEIDENYFNIAKERLENVKLSYKGC